MGYPGLTDVFSDDVLNLLLLETTLDDQSSATVYGTTGTQLSEQVSSNVLLSSLHALADIGNVGEDSLSVAFSHTLRRGNLVALCSGGNVVGVPLSELVEETSEEHTVANGLGLIVGPDTSSFMHVTLLLLRNLLNLIAFLELELLQLLGEVVLLRSLDLLLLLLEGQVETSILGGGSIVGRSCVGVGVGIGICVVDLLGLLLLLLEQGKVEGTVLRCGDFLSGCRLRVSKGLKGGRKRRRTRRVGLSRVLGFFGSVDHGHGTVSVDYYLFVGKSNGFARFAFGWCL
ncbi:hypothetical protein HG530_006350 [Fusarium avenaceum]|nr:hypothetical protein HG530_006350 [Fusarium avenaceum]